ncbi:DNA methyltransferase [Candidatus Riflebacteria bacterium]
MATATLRVPYNPQLVQDAKVEYLETEFGNYPRVIREFWTAKQRQMHSLHYAVSYRASFKPELPSFFIEHFSKPGDIVFDPFSGRGTTMLQANLMGRVGINNDINPLSERLAYPKTHPVTMDALENRLSKVDLKTGKKVKADIALDMFYHPDTESELLKLKNYLSQNRDQVDRFIELVAVSRLHGHSKGFFSAYSFPQISIPPKRQIRINKTRKQNPEYRDVASLILKKARAILKDGYIRDINQVARYNEYFSGDARDLNRMRDNTVDLVITSPPFLDKADYIQDNWLEHWFLDINPSEFQENLVQTPDLNYWKSFINQSFLELARLVKKNGFVAFEVGEVKHDRHLLNLEEILIEIIETEAALREAFRIENIFVNSQYFTKLGECFGVSNNQKGTNTNRILFLRRN